MWKMTLQCRGRHYSVVEKYVCYDGEFRRKSSAEGWHHEKKEGKMEMRLEAEEEQVCY